MQFLYKIQPVRRDMLTSGATSDEQEIIAQHFSYLKTLEERGVIILAGRTLNVDSTSFGIVIFNSESEEAAQRILHEDPAIKNNVFRGELFPYRIALFKEGNVKE